jgi:hypothetical protein
MSGRSAMQISLIATTIVCITAELAFAARGYTCSGSDCRWLGGPLLIAWSSVPGGIGAILGMVHAFQDNPSRYGRYYRPGFGGIFVGGAILGLLASILLIWQADFAFGPAAWLSPVLAPIASALGVYAMYRWL